ncbi:hypothetical protein GGH12_003947 [Coemansia sp. RSA 1822]|nr:hypothetical protein LPJ76_003524 [Coemansia sp. RSA 638]KAJ2121053.1 hypothetical protein IW147_004567 [Coemansia sp. RSA 720]KAJ2542468.1 hypothetical protein GGF49_002876 [Coemansia sp. RSA 1853]KAJ2561478.1 hypothetical protein GGH12_003947 [Coemansia sp. RSA 1822]
MPILNAVIDSLDALGDELCSLDMSQTRYNLTSLNVHHTFEPDHRTSYKVRNAEPHEAKLVAPGTKGVYEDMLSRIGVQHANLGTDTDMDARAFEEFYDKTVDLADLCQLPDVNDRLNHVANSYQDFSLRKEELTQSLKRLANIPRIRQRLVRMPQMQEELDTISEQRKEMAREADAQTQALDGMEKDVLFLRMERTMDEESEEQAVGQLASKRKELERLTAELETKRRLLEARRRAYQEQRPLTAVEHAEKLLAEIVRMQNSQGSETQNSEALTAKRDAYTEKLTEIIGNSDALDVANGYLDKVFASTIDSVANDDVDTLEGRRASRRLSMSVTPSGRVLAAQILCILYSAGKLDSSGMAEDELRTQITEFAKEQNWNPELVVQAMYEVLGKKLARRYRSNRTHMIRLLWD